MQTPLDPRFGPRALHLGARAIPWLSGPSPTAEVCIALRGEALREEERVELARWTHPREELDSPSAARPTRELRLFATRAELTNAAERSEVAAAMLAAQRGIEADVQRPKIMGILNVTPDSFSDGGAHFDHESALSAARRMRSEGASWIDVGGESTRPGAQPVECEEELRRVLPVLRALHAEGFERLSIDTRHAQVAAAALDAGATMVNDVGAGLDDERMLAVVAGADCQYVLMHKLGQPQDMQRAPHYQDVVAEVCEFLRARVAACIAAGIDSERLLVDPGLGFGKTLEHNLEILGRLRELRSLGIPLLVGPSRKSFIEHITGPRDGAPDAGGAGPTWRLGGTAAAISFCVRGGADVLRVHDVAVMAEACAVAAAISAHSSPPTASPC